MKTSLASFQIALQNRLDSARFINTSNRTTSNRHPLVIFLNRRKMFAKFPGPILALASRQDLFPLEVCQTFQWHNLAHSRVCR